MDPVSPDSLFQEATRFQTLDDITGPFCVTTVKGRRGVTSTRALTTGELLSAVQPLTLVHDPNASSEPGLVQDQGAAFYALVERLMTKRYSERELHALQALRSDGSHRRASGAAPVTPLELLDTAKLLRLDNADKSLPLPASVTREQMEDVVELNAFFADREDMALNMLTGSVTPTGGLLGLWPEYAMMSHSCVPNTISYIAGGKLVTRVSRPGVGEGTELTRTIQASIAFVPLTLRRTFLKENYGIDCHCQRCTAEEQLPVELLQMVVDMYEGANTLLEDLESDATEEGTEDVAIFAKDQLSASVQIMDAAFQKFEIPEQTQFYIQAGVFNMYELLYYTLRNFNEFEPQLTELLLALSGAVLPGGERHQIWAHTHFRQEEEAALDSAAEKLGVELSESIEAVDALARKSSQFKTADQLSFKAQCARYGRITPTVYRNVMDALQYAESDEDEEDGEAGEYSEGADGEEEADESKQVVDVESHVVPSTVAKP